MAYVSSHRAAAPGFLDLIGTAVASVKTALARRAIYVRTMNELHTLSDRELADLGISRYDVRNVALQAAYGR
jgi:uncharacterized protein YjiS (DUF1127 family)